MARDIAREPIRHIILSPRAIALGIGAILLLAACAGIYWHWRYALPPKTNDLPAIHALTSEITGDLPFESEENAFVRYRTLFMDTLGTKGAKVSFFRVVEGEGNDLFRSWVSARVDYSLDRLREGEWGDPRHDETLKRLREFRPILDGLDHATSVERFRVRYSSSDDVFNPSDDDDPASSADIHLSQISLFRALSQLNAAQMRVSANTDQWDDVLQRLHAGLRLAKHVSQDPFLFSILVAATTERETLEELRLVLLESSPPTTALDAMIDSIESLDQPPTLASRLALELRGVIGSIRWTWAIEDASFLSPYYWSERLMAPSPRESVRDAVRYIDEIATYSSLSRADRSTRAPPQAGAAGDYTWSLDRAIDTRDAQITERAGTLALLRILRFEREHGRLPRSLDEAMTTEQATDPVTGIRFEYIVGRDGMRAVNPAIDESTGARIHRQAPEIVPAIGPRWGFTLHAPLEASVFLRSVEFTQRRAEIYVAPNATP